LRFEYRTTGGIREPRSLDRQPLVVGSHGGRRGQRQRHELALEGLSGRIAWKLFEEGHIARHLVAGEAGPHVSLYLVGAQPGAVRTDDEGGETLAELRVVCADHRRLGDLRVGDEQRFHLTRVHVLPARHDHVVFAAVDGQASLRIEMAEVAARQEIVDCLADRETESDAGDPVLTGGEADHAGSQRDGDRDRLGRAQRNRLSKTCSWSSTGMYEPLFRTSSTISPSRSRSANPIEPPRGVNLSAFDRGCRRAA
jgi:hypothetical protein